MSILAVEKLNKHYPGFHLKDVSFTLGEGYIMGFIGANGAGKTTTLKSILNLVNVESGTIRVLNQDYRTNEMSLKQEIGYMFGGVDYYSKSRISKITDVVSRFYNRWDDNIYRRYMKRFSLDDSKRPSDLSHGMRIKYSLVLALSHHARLFILDEPTSGLDPVARDDLLELFQELIEDGDKSILFSTHITSDLEKCADFITFIKEGKIIESQSKDDLLDSYRLIKGSPDDRLKLDSRLISKKDHSFGFTGLIRSCDLQQSDNVLAEPPNLEDIMIYYAKAKDKEAANASADL